MTLKDDFELANTEKKLAGLEELIANKVAQPEHERAAGYEASVHSLKRFAEKLRKEIAEYQSVSAARK